MTPPHRMSLHPDLLWLTLNMILIIQFLLRNVSFSILHTPPDAFCVSLGTRTPG
jgi:hypothetical protein